MRLVRDRSITLKEVIHTHLHGEKYVTEMELPGKQTYFHGSPELTSIRELNCKYVGKRKCTFFTSHFAYAVNSAFPIGWTPAQYLTLKKFSKEIVFNNPLHPRYDVGYLYPIMLQLWPRIIDLRRPDDARNVAELLWRSGVCANLKTEAAMVEFTGYMVSKGWFSLDNKVADSDCNFLGVSIDMVVEVLHKEPRILGFCCYDGKDEESFGYPAIGIFQDKICDWISQHKPIRVIYGGERFNHRKNANEYIISIRK